MSILFAHPFFCMTLRSLTTVCHYIDRPEDINKALPDGTTPLNKAIQSLDYHLAYWLLAHGADPNGRPEGVIFTPLVQFIQLKRSLKKQDKQLVKSLLHHGADINGRNGYGNTALMQAAQTSSTYPQLIEFLLDQGADLALRTRMGNTIFWLGAIPANNESLKRYFQDLEKYHQEIHKQLAKQVSCAPKELWGVIYSYTSNAYPLKIKSLKI